MIDGTPVLISVRQTVASEAWNVVKPSLPLPSKIASAITVLFACVGLLYRKHTGTEEGKLHLYVGRRIEGHQEHTDLGFHIKLGSEIYIV